MEMKTLYYLGDLNLNILQLLLIMRLYTQSKYKLVGFLAQYVEVSIIGQCL